MTGSTFLCGAIRSENIVFVCLGNDLYFSGVGKLEHGARLILAGVLQDDDGVLAGRRLQDVPEVGRHRGQDHLVRIQGAPVRARQSNVDKILKMFFSSYHCKERHKLSREYFMIIKLTCRTWRSLKVEATLRLKSFQRRLYF